MSNRLGQDLISAALDDRRLLEHPFYRRWERGEVSVEELGDYAAQYRHFEAYLPGFLARLVAGLPEGEARDLVAANLADELGDPVAHTELFERFAGALGAGPADISPAMASLLSTYERLLADGPAAALAGFIAYESQSAQVARSKAEGLRSHYGMSGAAVSFWDHHAEVDVRHGAWAWDALSSLTGAPEDLVPALRAGAEAWWAFLDERQALAPAA
ncbi:MAG TPA: iron-containing redox enzyme family protein [Acidimicrobiales bacterium]|nr:iron-containing redox enzyme family protein [Acidimicrobiales bacterium]